MSVHQHPVNRRHHENLSFGQRAADAVATGMGSWKFIIIQTFLVAGWITLNTIAFVRHWDVFPYILLNLLFSTQAAYAAPIIMQSQNRQSAKDRDLAEHTYSVELAVEQLLKENTDLTTTVHQLTKEIHERVSKGRGQ